VATDDISSPGGLRCGVELSEGFEPLESSYMCILSIKTVFLLNLATAGRVSEVHALSALLQCLRFNLMALLR
jgi:hypothetical protein